MVTSNPYFSIFDRETQRDIGMGVGGYGLDEVLVLLGMALLFVLVIARMFRPKDSLEVRSMSEDMQATQERVVVIRERTPVYGTLSIVLGFIGIFVASFILSPLGLILGVMAMFSGQPISGVTGVLLATVGILTSPILIGLFGLGLVVSQ